MYVCLFHGPYGLLSKTRLVYAYTTTTTEVTLKFGYIHTYIFLKQCSKTDLHKVDPINLIVIL